MPPPSLGLFGKLPSETRLMIWESVIGHSFNLTTLLRTSRGIYEDLAERMYDKWDVYIHPCYGGHWMDPAYHIIYCRRLKITWRWCTVYSEHPIHRQKFPFHKAQLFVHILPPDPQEPGEIVSLWKKLNTMVRTLNAQAEHPKNIVVCLDHSRRRDWQMDGKAVESICYPGDRRPDHNIVFLPFCQLQNIGRIRVQAETWQLDEIADWALIQYGCDFLVHGGCGEHEDSDHSRNPEYRKFARVFGNLQALVMDTDFFLDTRLDTLPGRVAAMLRRDRFAGWFGFHQFPRDSPYQQKCLETIRKCPRAVNTHDPRLEQMLRRYRAFRLLYWTVPQPKLERQVRQRTEAWQAHYINGIFVLTEDQLEAEEERQRNARKHYPYERPGEYCEFDAAIHAYVGRNCGGNWPMRRPRYESRWCPDCRHVGFVFGCGNGCKDDAFYWFRPWHMNEVDPPESEWEYTDSSDDESTSVIVDACGTFSDCASDTSEGCWSDDRLLQVYFS
ncbi:hypothetical protein P168DRAFT_305703 [Aspergillus campestris IBT 28561]|uniref:Uncharacterized protein n=1 Tax=Aspergillus campestris (strain IBT 28561) TaxID=1392248 RepID=A0A2I1D0P0_ASPC2|nr:uncharacterized protein P168DRAFT_305703 [Aspergillus campestris IBT 28561]PKY03428.1 hypothetical protein P168DRAFT_305703 [Aspergillus campestris IBT 28561]